MQLNIYLIDHPIIQSLSKSIRADQRENKFQIQNYKYIGLILIYEISRKWITVHSLYIKKIKYTKEIILPKNQEKYYICTPIHDTYQMLSELSCILPQVQIIDTANDIKLFKNNLQSCINKSNSKNIKIIILETILYNTYIIELIKYLNKEELIPITNIHIGCITCYNTILNLIGQHYSQLKIYTTKIIQ